MLPKGDDPEGGNDDMIMMTILMVLVMTTKMTVMLLMMNKLMITNLVESNTVFNYTLTSGILRLACSRRLKCW